MIPKPLGSADFKRAAAAAACCDAPFNCPFAAAIGRRCRPCCPDAVGEPLLLSSMVLRAGHCCSRGVNVDLCSLPRVRLASARNWAGFRTPSASASTWKRSLTIQVRGQREGPQKEQAITSVAVLRRQQQDVRPRRRGRESPHGTRARISFDVRTAPFNQTCLVFKFTEREAKR